MYFLYRENIYIIVLTMINTALTDGRSAAAITVVMQIRDFIVWYTALQLMQRQNLYLVTVGLRI